MEPEINIQCPICPFCHDDHSSEKQCEPRDLKRVIMKTVLDDYEITDDNKLKKKLTEMIAYF